MLVCTPATGALKRIDCQIPGPCACHPCNLPGWWLGVRFCVYCHFTESMPPLSSRFSKPTLSWQFAVRYITSGFAVVVLLYIACHVILHIFALVCAVRAWTAFDYASNSALSLVAVCQHVLRVSLSRLCPCFSLCRDVSIWRCRFLRSCRVERFSPRLVLRLFPLPCRVVCHTFVLVRAALDRTGCASNSVLSVVFVCQRLLQV